MNFSVNQFIQFTKLRKLWLEFSKTHSKLPHDSKDCYCYYDTCAFLLKLGPPFIVNVWKKDQIIGLFSPTKHLLFYGCSMEEIKSYSFVMTAGWVNDARIFLFGRSNPLRGRRGRKWASAIELNYSQHGISSIQIPSFILAAPRACKYFRESKTPHFYLNEHLCSSQCITLIEVLCWCLCVWECVTF